MGGRYALEDLELQVLILHNKRRGRSVMELTEEEPGDCGRGCKSGGTGRLRGETLWPASRDGTHALTVCGAYAGDADGLSHTTSITLLRLTCERDSD